VVLATEIEVSPLRIEELFLAITGLDACDFIGEHADTSMEFLL